MLGLLEDLELQVDLADSGMKIDDEAMLRVPSQDDISLDVDKGDSGTDHIVEQPVSDSALATAHIAVEQTKRQLRGMKRKFALTTLSDPDELKNVKIAIDLLKNAMKETIPQDDDSFKLGLGNVVQAYQSLIESCKSYEAFLNSRKILFRQDKLMREMIQQIVQQSIAEQTAFLTVVGQDYYSGIRYAGKDWTDVLYAVRAIRLDEADLKSAGANTSELRRIDNPDKTVSFVKMEEKTLSRVINQDESVTIEVLNMFAEIGDAKRQKLIEDILKNKESFDHINDLVQSMIRRFSGPTPDTKETFVDIFKGLYKDSAGKVMGDSFESFIGFAFRKFMERSVSLMPGLIDPGSVISDRNVSTTRVAERLGVGDLVAKSRTVLVKRKDGRFAKANSMEGVTGTNVMNINELNDKLKSDWKSYKVRFAGKAIRQLLDLQILDLICGQVDRNWGNIMATCQLISELSECVIEEIKGIDNDLSFGQLDKEVVHRSAGTKIGKTLGLFEDDTNRVSVPFISRSFYERIMSKGMRNILEIDQLDLRTDDEIAYLKYRFDEVRDKIEYLVNTHRMWIIDDEKEFLYMVHELAGNGLAENYYSRILRSFNER